MKKSKSSRPVEEEPKSAEPVVEEEPMVAESVVPTIEDITSQFVGVDGSCITVNSDSGHHCRSVNAATKYTINGKDAFSCDLQEGDIVTLTGDPVTLVSTTR